MITCNSFITVVKPAEVVTVAINSTSQQFKTKIQKVSQTVYDLLPNKFLLTIAALGVQKKIGHSRMMSLGHTSQSFKEDIQGGGGVRHEQDLGCGRPHLGSGNGE